MASFSSDYPSDPQMTKAGNFLVSDYTYRDHRALRQGGRLSGPTVPRNRILSTGRRLRWNCRMETS